jgi:hypothetical protein
MSAPASTESSDNPVRGSNEPFVALLPSIRRQATAAARRLPVRVRSEFVLDVVAAAYVLYARLISRKLTDSAYATPLATYAIAHVRAGRSVGVHFNGRDVMCAHAQRCRGFAVVSLEGTVDRFGRSWRETLVDKRSLFPQRRGGIPTRLRSLAQAAVGEGSRPCERASRRREHFRSRQAIRGF